MARVVGVAKNIIKAVNHTLFATNLVREGNPKEILIFGDSELLIKMMANKKRLKDPVLNKQLSRVTRILKDFPSVQFFHILRGLNKEADRLANIGCTLQDGMISINAETSTMAIIP